MGSVVVMVVELEADADLVQPKEGPLGTHVKHHKGVDRAHLPTGFTNHDQRKRNRDGT